MDETCWSSHAQVSGVSISGTISAPLYAGGGIRNAATAKEKVAAGASMVVCGNLFESNEYDNDFIQEIATAIHGR